jgi:hypothetical protein
VAVGLLELAPTPAAGARLKPKQIEKLLAEHRIRRLDVETVRAALAEVPLHVAPGATEAAVAHIRTLLPRLRVTVQQRATCQREMGRLLERRLFFLGSFGDGTFNPRRAGYRRRGDPATYTDETPRPAAKRCVVDSRGKCCARTLAFQRTGGAMCVACV